MSLKAKENELPARLMACAELVVGDFVCDVGTDHALLPTYLVGSGRCKRAVASDIADGPLEAAQRTVSAHGLAQSITLIRSDGLDNIPPDGISDIVIAGMGGELIAELVCRCEWLRSGIRLILQPMTKPEKLRRALAKTGFEITAEHCVSDSGHIYVVICAHFTGLRAVLTDMAAHIGALDYSLPDERKYAAARAEIHSRILDKLPEGHPSRGFEARLTQCFEALSKGENYMTVRDIYNALDKNIPFSLTQSDDNSGLLVGSGDDPVSKVMLALDITCEVIAEATEKNASLIISHHPVIYRGLYEVSPESPVGMLLRSGISAICTHSPLDLSPSGMNKIIYDMLREPLCLSDETEEFEAVLPDGTGFGRILTAKKSLDAKKLGEILREVFGCTVVRYTATSREIRRIAYCSGGGKSNTTLAVKRGCDAYITGDVSHDRLIEAKNCGLALYDCGHFHTENIACEHLRQTLTRVCPQVEFIIAESSRDPAEYIF